MNFIIPNKVVGFLSPPSADGLTLKKMGKAAISKIQSNIPNVPAQWAATESSAAGILPIPCLKVLEAKVYKGPHRYSMMPMVSIKLDLGKLEQFPTNLLPNFTLQLLNILPTLRDHGCCFKSPGGFVRRLQEGTWLGHVVEHVALELQSLIGIDVTRGKTRGVPGQEGVYFIMFAYQNEEVALLAGRLALQLVNSLLPADLQGIDGLNRITRLGYDYVELEQNFNLEAALKTLTQLNQRLGLGPSTEALVKEAIARGIPVNRLDNRSFLQLGWGQKQQRLRASVTGKTSLVAVELAGDKNLTKSILSQAGIPCPRGTVVRTLEGAFYAAEDLTYPLVTKPLDGNHGRGVSINIKNPTELQWGFEQAKLHGNHVIVEEFYPGKDYRVLVINGKVIAVAERVPAHVVGDGMKTIEALVAEVNSDPRRGEGHEKTLTRIVLDEAVDRLLLKSALNLQSIPSLGQIVYLKDTANLSTGGTAIDRTDDIHPDNLDIAQRAALAVGLDVAGIDMVAPDISQSFYETTGGIVEVNAAPGLRMHLQPTQGKQRNVAKPMIDMLFPNQDQGRIPVFAITGTNGKSTTTRMVAHILQQSGLRVGMTCTSGVYINNRLIRSGDCSGPRSAQILLNDSTIQAAVLETARGGILREGLAFDKCNAGAVLNVTPDHLKLHGVNTLDDLAAVKSVVVESVCDTGCSILNADDPMTEKMKKYAKGKVILFSLHGGPSLSKELRDHIGSGGFAIVREPGSQGGSIVIHHNGQKLNVVSVAEIPATLEGMAEFNIQNAMAAIAMCWCQNVPLAAIRSAMANFSCSFEQSPGRLNIYDGHNFRVIMDYAHNPASLTALGDVLEKMQPSYNQIIGMLGIPGDRRDEDIIEMGRIAAGLFDILVLRETPDNRGRKDGEIMNLLMNGAVSVGFNPKNIYSIFREEDAVDACLNMARKNDLIVLMPTRVEAMWKKVQDFKPKSAAKLSTWLPAGPASSVG